MTLVRVERLRELLADRELEALVVTQVHNRRYLSGFTASAPGDGALLITQDEALILTDFRYYEQVAKEAPSFQLVQVSDTLKSALAGQVKALGLCKVGFESRDLPVATLSEWQAEMPNVEWVATQDLVEGLRAVKDEAEIAAIQRAVHLADEAMAHIMSWLRPGVTEKEVAWELEVYMRTHGATKLSFDMIVAAGPNGSMPHAVTSERRIERGDPIVIDMGCVIDGYCSDLTRSFCLGEAPAKYLEAWQIVREAQQAAEEAIVAGMAAVEADGVARSLIDATAFAGRFGHGLGHGVGLEIHEKPRVGRLSQDVLQAGNVVTVEPGIYLPGEFGIRIEDMVVVTEQGAQVLTSVGKEAVI